MYILILYSLIVSILIFGIFHYVETANRENKEIEYNIYENLVTLNNGVIFCFLNIVIFAIIYLAFDETTDILAFVGLSDYDYGKMNTINKSNIVDPSMLRNTTEAMKSGFEPYNSCGDTDDSSSDSSSVS